MAETISSQAGLVDARAILSGLTQATRLLRLTTPLGADVLRAECVRGEEGLSLGFRFQIAALSTDAAIALKSLLGQPVLLELLTAADRDQLCAFHGHVTTVDMAGANGGLARYNLSVRVRHPRRRVRRLPETGQAGAGLAFRPRRSRHLSKAQHYHPISGKRPRVCRAADA